LIFGAFGATMPKICPASEPLGAGSALALVYLQGKESQHMSQQGTVKWFNNAKGYGFIQTEEGGEDVFVHHTAIVAEGFRTLNQGEKVSFELEQGPKGLHARNVLRV
jgi:CspA family cold shock protein